MLRHVLHDTLTLNWAEFRGRPALPCILAIALCLFLGLILGHPIGGMMAAGGALAVGFGAFQTLGSSRLAPMLWASVGMAISSAGGALVGHSAPGALFNGAFAGFGCGLLTALGPGTSWIGMQCGIFALIASGFPAGVHIAVTRALLILLGGLLQTLIVLYFQHRHAGFAVPLDDDPFEGVLPAIRSLWENLTWKSDAFRYGVRLGATLGLAAVAAHFFTLSNGYWVPMTTLIVLKIDAQQTYSRGLARVAGTLLGAGLCTLLASLLRPDPWALAALVVLFAWLCYSLINVNYGLFAVCITGYIAFLLALAGLPTRDVVIHRLANTAFGDALALLAYFPVLLMGRAKPPETPTDPAPAPAETAAAK